MACKALAWLAVLGLVAPAGAQEVRQRPDDLPDNIEEFRQTPHTDDTPVPEQEAGTGGSGQAGTHETRRGELSGEVVRVEGDQLWLRHAGAVFPLELTRDTRFTPDRQQALRPGQEVRASFTLERDGYVVNALEPVEQSPRERSPAPEGETEQKATPGR
ncbi:hypothetical protein JQX13_13905 [Archangium violaceum]|uniref:hypothetical protein n=1 Tax=Archangium violaceum TaxID=83451 RepID=UPI00193BA2F5|nr:hypothetical protein [Archangium violaceum]QRK11062.1 hypothetical protein JQX13_13905 [Archangium violaceum]